MIQCFWLEATLTAQRSLRRYASLPEGALCGRYGHHNGQTPIDVVPFEIRGRKDDSGYKTFDYLGADRLELFERTDSRWPLKCDRCEYHFSESDPYQVFMDELYRRTDNGEILALCDAPPGAMWDAWWYGDSNFCSFPIDGVHLMVRCPDGADGSGTADWYVDGRAGNGDRHSRGWTRSGDPKADPPTITANPSIQITCDRGYHGWLQGGKLTPA